ncbi:hypothetical protein BBJ29_001971 [Phytophthora kernoviae]|uniref:UPF3 domain-containing protein n=1 Tax=Phytophthora kernoviae TaxID=325452 RepID=A0A3R7JSE6_9STRA|nr:hypothetical protein BBJ29_001971 [Phytophthora kernoviae]
MKSWVNFHPNWIYVFWTDEDNLKLFELLYPQYLHVAKAVKKVSLADMARYALLHRIGGLYVDADFECLQPFDGLRRDHKLFLSSEPLAHTVLLEKATSAMLCNALMASAPGHPFWLHVLDNIKEKFARERLRSDAVGLTGPRMVNHTYMAQKSMFDSEESAMTVLPSEYFYPEVAYWNIEPMEEACQRRKDDAAKEASVTAVLKKLVVRNIPPTATEEEARRLLEAHGVGTEFVWRFVPGRKRSNNHEPMPARLYLDTKKEPEKARKLIAALHGQMFYQDAKEGDAKPLDVEFAPFQKIPREKQRKDAKVGTIDRDPEYTAFLEELAKPKDKLPSAEAAVDMAEGESVERPVAALVKYLNERKVHSRDKGKGKSGKALDKNGVRRLTRKKDGSKQKGAKDKKALKDRQKKNSDAPSGQDSTKPRKQRTEKTPSKKESTKPVPTEPGTLRIMAPKSAPDSSGSAPAIAAKVNGAPQSADASLERRSEKRAPKSGKKNGGRGRGEKKAKEVGDGVGGDGTDVADLKPHPRRKGGNNGKKETTKKDLSKKEQGNRGDRARGDPAIKLVLLGNGSVGKSSLIARFVDDGFARVYKQTIGLDFFEKKLQLPRDQRIVLQVWDIGGQTINSKMLSKYLFGVHVALLCYDVTDAQSFSDVEDWLRVARENGGEQMNLYLVGNKTDLVAHRVISNEKHEAFIRQHGLPGGFLVSAQSGDNVLKTVYRISAAAANIRVSEFELSFCDKVVRAVIPVALGTGSNDPEGKQEARTAMADEIEAEDRANELRKSRKMTQHRCRIM